MPTSKVMLPVSRGSVALVVVLTALGIVPTAAGAAPAPSTSTTTSSSTTTTTAPSPDLVPPPPAFAMPIDIGLQLLEQRNTASAAIRRFGGALPDDRVHARAMQRAWNRLQHRLERLAAKARKTQRDLDVARENLQSAAVDAYMNAGDGRLTAALAALTSAKSAMEASRSMHLIGSFSERQDQLVERYIALKRKLAVQRARVTRQREQADVRLAHAKAKVVKDKREIAHARVRLTASVVGIMEFQKAATSASSPILGPSLLTAEDLAAWVHASGHRPRITVSIEALARYYIIEGEAAGVRGDVAFAQSILETYWFTFPGGGQLAGSDNNFAGIGACDSCHHGFRFASARRGVRAQMQALRVYVDPDMIETTLKYPLVMPKMLNLGFRGKVQTWWDLWGTWATGAFYGQRVYDIYERMAAFAAERSAPAPALAG